MKILITTFGFLYSLIGVLYIRTDPLWGMLVLVIGAVYLFGLERFGSDEERHVLSHIVVGGMMAGFSGGFLIVEKAVEMIKEEACFTPVDSFFLILTIPSVYIALRSTKKFV